MKNRKQLNLKQLKMTDFITIHGLAFENILRAINYTLYIGYLYN